MQILEAVSGDNWSKCKARQGLSSLHSIIVSLLPLHFVSHQPQLLSWLYPLSPSSQTFWVVVGSLLSSLYEFFHRRLLPRFMPGKETSATFIGLLLYFFHFQINWFRRFYDKRNFFYPIFILCISFVGMFVSVRSTHEISLKAKLIDLLPIRGVDPLG